MDEPLENGISPKPRKRAPPSIKENPTVPGTKQNAASKSRGRVRSHTPNHRGRSTTHLSEGHIIAAIDAATHARTIGMPLNRFLTIHLERGELPGRAQDSIAAFLKPAAAWLRQRGIPLTRIWWLEHATGTGIHAHMFLHVPPELSEAFGHQARHRWLKAAGLVPHQGVIRTERIGPRGFDITDAPHKQHQSYANQLKGVVRYMGKTIDPEATSSLHRHLPKSDRPTVATAFGIKPEYSHPIYGRRISVSENIGPAARKRFEAERLRHALLEQAARSAAVLGVPIKRDGLLAIQQETGRRSTP